MLNKIKLITIIAVVVLISSACSLNFNSGATRGDGGIYVSINKGNSWKQINVVPSITANKNISFLDINIMAMDPNDSAAVYVGSFERGMYYTYDINKGWTEAYNLNKNTISDIAISPRNKCIIFTAIDNKVFRSDDCNRSWQEIFYDNNPEVRVTTIDIDHYNSNNIYIGTSRGEVIRSIDEGFNWRTIRRFDDGIGKIVVHPQDSRLVFVATEKNEVYRFNSNSSLTTEYLEGSESRLDGTNWTSLGEAFDDMEFGKEFRDLVISPTDGIVFLASKDVILKSTNNGESWARIKLITPEEESTINAIAVSPKTSNDVYYVTDTTFFRSENGGTSWTTKKLDSSRGGSDLVIDFDNPNVIYMGMRKDIQQ